jgi:hypothetical protein
MWQALAALEGHTALPLPSQHELQLGLLPRLALFYAYSAAFSAWTYFLLLRRTRPGAVRLLAALPWLVSTAAAPACCCCCCCCCCLLMLTPGV